jgi:hypothetical protein
MTPSGSGHSFLVAAGVVISIASPSVVYVAVYVLQPAEPLSSSSSEKVAVISVPVAMDAKASRSSPRTPVASHDPTSVAAPKRRSSSSSASRRTSSSSSTRQPATRSSAARNSISSRGGTHAIRVDTIAWSSSVLPSTVCGAL